jgi:CubicO group peptidase (beta-lactamase class C family)
MRTILLCLTLSTFGLIAINAFGQQVNNQSRFERTTQGGLGVALIEAVNSGDKTVQQNFVTSRMSEGALKNTPSGVWLSLLQKLFEQSNGLDVVSAASEGERLLNIVVRSRQGNHWARLVLISSRSDPAKLSDIFVLPALDPVLEQKSRFPKSRVSRRQAIKIIEDQVQLRASIDSFSGVVLVAEGDRIIFNRAVGMAEKSFNVSNDLNTKFHLGSMDKMFTGVAIAQLVQAGKLSFNDTLAKVLPDFPNHQMAERISIHQLLTHTAGTGDFISNPEFRQNRAKLKNLTDYLPLVAGEQLLFEPGSRWSYSNSGYVILGLVIEKLSGESYFDYVRNHIFKVARMNDTGYYELNEVVPNRAVGYLRDAAEDPFGIEPRRSNVMFIPFKGNSAGGSYSTAPDLLRFTQALRARKLIRADLTELVTSGKVAMVGVPRPGKYAYGFAATTIKGKEVRGMTGGGESSGVNSSLEMFWHGSYSIIVMGNYDAPAAENLNYEICEFLALQ